MDDQPDGRPPGANDDGSAVGGQPAAPDPLESALWREDALRWYLELREDEQVIAPWLSLEWTGERMRVRRG